ncbi:MaoC family dehydratase [uncultured Nocardioides sp.]|uniref:MaoC family dehydratase n=1 Tax=uncultured Nocardioides sp. TaxID=198441 RepID=UPI0026375650|nr:MaoC family dehydratase [uncultured Nocardioides sp.]
MRTFTSLDEVSAAAGSDIGTSDWFEITQDRVNGFADATEDHQWIHVDAERAAEGPFGTTIAHGYLTLSLLPFLGSKVVTFDFPGPKLNYGLNKVRFPQFVKVGARVRDHLAIGEVTEASHGLQVAMKHTIEIDGEDKPACVAENLILLLQG